MEGKIHMDDEMVLQTIVASATTGSAKAITVALDTHTNIVIWLDGKIVEVPPETFKINK